MEPTEVYNRFNRIYEDFKRYVHSDESDIYDWRPGARNELIVYMNDGSVISYDSLNKTFSYIRRYDENERGDYDLSDEDYKAAFSDKLRRLMRGALLNQRQLSEATGINVTTLSHYMTGRNLPDSRNMKRLSHALNCSLAELMDFE